MNENRQISLSLLNQNDSLQITYRLLAIHNSRGQGRFASMTVRMQSSLPLSVHCFSFCLPQRFPSSIKQGLYNLCSHRYLVRQRLTMCSLSPFSLILENLAGVYQTTGNKSLSSRGNKSNSAWFVFWFCFFLRRSEQNVTRCRQSLQAKACRLNLASRCAL